MSDNSATRDVARYPTTPDGRYFVVKERLWRLSNPRLHPSDRESYVGALMAARRAVGAARRKVDTEAELLARVAVDRAKRNLGERGPVWWSDGAQDWNRYLIKNTPYQKWYEALQAEQVEKRDGNRDA
ncbi:hypothetical protein [Microvirga antarctica]|uniref:hypothetical protein n=1 Tax=Microvirga antarctica TaxID=2819233 RepID=UPI001B312509|nr:hypothetical protein [Microvirga antarctica]